MQRDDERNDDQSVEDTPAMFGDTRLDQFLAVGVQQGQCSQFVFAHQTRIADDVGDENRREMALDAIFGHDLLRFRDRAISDHSPCRSS